MYVYETRGNGQMIKNEEEDGFLLHIYPFVISLNNNVEIIKNYVSV